VLLDFQDKVILFKRSPNLLEIILLGLVSAVESVPDLGRRGESFLASA